MQTLTPRVFLLVLFTIFLVNFFGLRDGWYLAFPWLDIPMHLAGGAWLASFVIYLLKRWGMSLRGIVLTFFVLGIVAVVGIAWEWYEYLADVFVSQKHPLYSAPGYILFDTLTDLVNDILGALAVLVATFFKRRPGTSIPSSG